MPDVVTWILYYPYPKREYDAPVTTANPYSGNIGQLWTLAKTGEHGLADRIGSERCML